MPDVSADERLACIDISSSDSDPGPGESGAVAGGGGGGTGLDSAGGGPGGTRGTGRSPGTGGAPVELVSDCDTGRSAQESACKQPRSYAMQWLRVSLHDQSQPTHRRNERNRIHQAYSAIVVVRTDAVRLDVRNVFGW